jgi:hypothetical protein
MLDGSHTGFKEQSDRSDQFASECSNTPNRTTHLNPICSTAFKVTVT